MSLEHWPLTLEIQEFQCDDDDILLCLLLHLQLFYVKNMRRIAATLIGNATEVQTD